MGRVYEALYKPSNRVAEPKPAKPAATHSPSVAKRIRPSTTTSPKPRAKAGQEDFEFAFKGSRKWALELQKIGTYLSSMESTMEHHGRVIVFTSIQRRTGTTTVSEYIAKFMATEDERNRVLYLDLSGSVKDSEDMYDMLAGEKDIDDLIAEHSAPGINHISANLTGEQSHATVISRRFKQFLDRSRTTFDWIVIDAPPFPMMPATYSLARVCDGVVLVIKAGHVRRPAINALVDDLEKLGVNILGAILNFRTYPIPRALVRFF